MIRKGDLKLLGYGISFAAGAVIYTFLEIIWRGYTHPSMTLAGGICLMLTYMWSGLLSGSPAPLKWLAGAATITAVEFIIGCVVNIGMRQHVWDYSSFKFNIMGQVCLAYFVMWYFLSIPAFYICDKIRLGS